MLLNPKNLSQRQKSMSYAVGKHVWLEILLE